MVTAEIARIEIFGKVERMETVRSLFEAGLEMRAMVDGSEHRFPLCDEDDYVSFVDEMLECARKEVPFRVMSFGGDPDMWVLRKACENESLSYAAAPCLWRDSDPISLVYHPGMRTPREIDVDARRRPILRAECLLEFASDPVALGEFVSDFLRDASVGGKKSLTICPRVAERMVKDTGLVAA